ncbi:MAG: bifunctional precorrin-2 dehydrogenase/sirohydrochlorin ferrochelatase [Gemmatimonadota bacterium]|nr:bifunctional precorrin-2 dehydrogenase/sirohydrochlorin ferrochelatase [Gemmatimonadota bacterium]
MSTLPILVEGSGLRVLVVGGGNVATRKARQFAQAGAVVRIVAPALDAALEEVVREFAILVDRRPYATGDIGDAQLVICAADDRMANTTVARDALADNRLLNAADHSSDGNFAMMATHHRGPLTIGISAGGVPAAAIRIRNAIAERFDARYGDALSALGALRKRTIASGNAELWRARSPALIDEDFCDAVEGGDISQRIAEWP